MVSDIESIFETEVWSDFIFTKKVNFEVLNGLYQDFLENPKKFKFDVLWIQDQASNFESLSKIMEIPTIREFVMYELEILDQEPTI